MASVHIRYEVWVGESTTRVMSFDQEVYSRCYPETDVKWRFNACFDTRQRAEDEVDWYIKHGYTYVEVRIRTTRYQRREHITTGGTDV